MPKWTEAQECAINAKNSNILVSAAAGSGKTAVLVERVVRLITDESNPVDVDKLLVVTFTNAAAAEMKSRISKSLSRIIKEQPNNTNAIRQLALLSNAKICTIDSFCINLVRENFFKLGIAQDFRILETSQEMLIEQNAIEELIEKLYEDDDSEFKALVELLSTTKNDAELINAVKRIANYITSQAFPEEWLSTACELYNPNHKFSDGEIYEYIAEEIRYYIDYAISLIENSKENLDVTDGMCEAYLSLLNEDCEIFTSLKELTFTSWDKLKKGVESVSFSSVPRSPKGYESEMKRIIFANRNAYKKIVSSYFTELLSATEADIQKDNEYLYPIFITLIKLISSYKVRTLEIKHEMNAYSFSDIEHFAINLLFYKDENGNVIRTDLAKEYENSFYEILVDEYQDTNAAQDTLFEMLSNGRNRFMVGDVKQSIYRFRLAMPQIFTDKKELFEPYSDKDCENKKIILDTNFRSRKGICEFTNFVFSNLMTKRVGELDYNSEEYLNNGSEFHETDVPAAQIKLIETPDGESADEYEAHQAAKLILSKINNREQIKDGDTTRDIRFGDIAVLFRSPKNRMHIFSKVFAEYSIPVVSNNKVNLFENNEVSILISLLRVIDNPVQDIPLLAVLMSVFYGYTADDIASAKLKTKAGNLYGCITGDSERFFAFLNDIERYREYAASMSVESFIRQILSETSYFSLISAMGNQEQRKLNVMKLLELASVFDKGENVGLTAFIRYIDAVIEAKLDIESADVTGIRENCVSLMSIHKSKGLEFPIVILAGASRKYNTDDLRAPVLLNDKYGVGLKVNNEEGLYRYNSIQYSTIKNLNTYSLMSENLRVLYVAITRAKEQFIALTSYPDLQTHINNLSAKLTAKAISPVIVKGIANDADMLLLCALLHRDGKILRDYCDNSVDHYTDSSFKLDVEVLNSDLLSNEKEETVCAADEDLVLRISEKLSYKYARSELSAFSSKRTASSLDEKEQSFKYFAKSKPSFLSANALTPAEKGTAMHAFMQFCNYENAKNDLNAEIERLTELSFISERQASCLDKEKLNTLFSSDFAKRLFNSDRIYRELKVSSFVPINELEKTDFNECVLIQGIADCVFEESGELVLVDYKTDFVTSEEELLELYKNQVSFYKKAVEKTLKMPVKESMLYSFSLSKPCIYK